MTFGVFQARTSLPPRRLIFFRCFFVEFPMSYHRIPSNILFYASKISIFSKTTRNVVHKNRDIYIFLRSFFCSRAQKTNKLVENIQCRYCFDVRNCKHFLRVFCSYLFKKSINQPNICLTQFLYATIKFTRSTNKHKGFKF